MAEEANVVERETDTIQAEVDVTRAGMVDKMEALEEGMKDAWQSATDAVNDSVGRIQASVETTTQAVQGAVHGTVDAAGRALDFPAHVRRHPWLMVSGAVLLGVAAGVLVDRLRR